MDSIAGLPFWEVEFDEHGVATTGVSDAVAAIAAADVTDLVVFAHGWNNDRAVADQLYEEFFGTMADQLAHVRTDRPVRVGLTGVFWPSARWPDEPVASFGAPAPAASTPVLDDGTLASLRDTFPAASDLLDRLAGILAGPPATRALTEFQRLLGDFATTVASGKEIEDDGEGSRSLVAPAMLGADPGELFRSYGDALRQAGAMAHPDDGSGAQGIGVAAGLALFGAKEALRQLTYWQMKGRAGAVGRAGLGPLIGQLHAAAPRLRIHLIGHSFGARLVSYALAGPAPAWLEPGPSPVKSVTLIEGAFSQWAFARRLPFDPTRSGALVDVPGRVDGPLVATFSCHDTAVGTFYPMASMASDDDSAALGDARSRWGGIGANGAQGAQARSDGVRGAGPGITYPYAPSQVLNIDASEVVCRGWAPAGAHGDIVHPELTWIVLTAGGITL